MSNLHLQTENGYSTAIQMSQSAQAMAGVVQSLRSALGQLDYAWQGGVRDEFLEEAGALRQQLDRQADALMVLVNRLENEIREWEETDRRGAALFGEAGIGSGALVWLSSLPYSSGGGGTTITLLPGFALTIPPLVISSLAWGEQLPAWLKDWLNRLFPPAPIVSPLPEPVVSPLPEKKAEPAPQEQPVPPPVVETPILPKYEIFHDVPARSQGNLYGSAACAPTSASMVMDYFHAKDTASATADPETLIRSLDPGDGTSGKGISLSNMTDELGELGYNNISQQVNASVPDLKTALEDGPVIVTAGVGIVGPGTVTSNVARAITGPGNTIHALVVKGVTENGAVVVNDPWTGGELTFEAETFGKMWANGSNGMYVIRP